MLQWFAIPFSSGSCFVTLHHDGQSGVSGQTTGGQAGPCKDADTYS